MEEIPETQRGFAIWITPTIMAAASSVRYTLMARLKQVASIAAVIIGTADPH